MEDENQQLIEKYKSYFDKLQNGFPTKEYVGSKLVANLKTQFCNNENGSCRFTGQESVENNKLEVIKSDPETTSINNEASKDFYESNNIISANSSSNSLHHPFIHPAVNFQLWQSGPLNNIQSMPNMPNNISNSFLSNQSSRPSFQRISNLNRSLRFPPRNPNNNNLPNLNNSFYFKSY
jgi:hypothetical protein